MRELPSYQTNLVPMGVYNAVIDGEIQEKTSTFDPSKTYLELALNLTSQRGETFSYAWCFTPKSPMYANFLQAIGGRRLASGNILPPKSPYLGRQITVQVNQRPAKGSKDGRLVNEIVAVFPCEEALDAEEIPDEEGEASPF